MLGSAVSIAHRWSTQTYEKQPPSATFFFVLDQPPSGGDTLFASQVEAYNRLSPEFQKRLEGLRAVHSAVAQADYSRDRGGPVRREPIETEVSFYVCPTMPSKMTQSYTIAPCRSETSRHG